MIVSLMIINNFGKPRLTKFYQQTSEQRQQQIVRELYATLITRAETASSFIDATQWFPDVSGPRVIYRLYATLYFCIVIDGSESELGILDLIQVMVEALDRHFKNVCELDIIFSSPQCHWLVDEMIVGGLVVETNPSEILEAVEAQAKVERQQTDVGVAAAAAQQKLDAIAGSLGSLGR